MNSKNRQNQPRVYDEVLHTLKWDMSPNQNKPTRYCAIPLLDSCIYLFVAHTSNMGKFVWVVCGMYVCIMCVCFALPKSQEFDVELFGFWVFEEQLFSICVLALELISHTFLGEWYMYKYTTRHEKIHVVA